MLVNPLHEDHLLRYSVEIIQDDGNQEYKSIANISFYDENNKRVQVFKYNVLEKELIYNWIENGTEVNLSGAYVRDFSLTEYRTIKGLDDGTLIKINDLKARKTFFDCDISTDFSYAEFLGDKVVFESAIFGNGYNNFFGANFGHGQVNFKKAKFGSGGTSFRSVRFGDGDVTFNHTNFGNGDLNFVDADFHNGNVDYKNSIFGNGNVDFKFAKFSAGDISFEKATFGKGKKDFKNVEFGGGKIDFRRISFNDGDVSFEGVEFGNGKVSFRSSSFGHGHKSFELTDFADGDAQFDNVNFGSGTVSFNQAKVSNISFVDCHLDAYMDLRFGECKKVDLRSTVVRDILDIKPQSDKVIIKELNIVDMRILGRLFINWRENNVYHLIHSQTNTDLFSKAEQFRILKENFRNNGQYDDEDAAYIEFRRCEAKANLESALKEGKKNSLWAYPVYYFQKYVFDFIGRYATNPSRVLGNMLLTFSIFSFIYFIVSVWASQYGHVVAGGSETLALNNPEMNLFESFGNALYYSGITFLTIGYGDYFAWGILKPIAVLEGFTGVFMMSYFTVAFVRKILR